jgi:hypothetical protein
MIAIYAKDPCRSPEIVEALETTRDIGGVIVYIVAREDNQIGFEGVGRGHDLADRVKGYQGPCMDIGDMDNPEPKKIRVKALVR